MWQHVIHKQCSKVLGQLIMQHFEEKKSHMVFENGDICRCVNGENSLYLRFLFAEIINWGKNMALDINDFNLTQCILILYVKTKTIGLQYLNGSNES